MASGEETGKTMVVSAVNSGSASLTGIGGGRTAIGGGEDLSGAGANKMMGLFIIVGESMAFRL